jgi:ADP-heptose:LPS heptosyltransferase
VAVTLLVAYRALGLGDLLTGVPALRGLARAFPDHRRVLAAPPALAPLAALTGAVHEVAGVAALEPLPAALHGAGVAVNLHGRGPQSRELLLAARPRRLISFGEPPAPQWRAGEHEVARWCRLLTDSGIAADPADLHIATPPVDPPAAARGATILHPGAASEARRWPVERWAEVARAIGPPLAITGGPQERELAHAVARLAGLPERVVLAGRTGLLGLAAAVAAAERVLSADTGVAHLATALRTPSVVLFGPVPPSEWGPPPDPRHNALWAGRRGDPHGAAPDPGLLEIGPCDVVEALAAGRPRAWASPTRSPDA